MAEIVTFTKRKPCPICAKLSDPKHHPFCSNRCREVDLCRWLKGHYASPEDAQDGDEDDTTS